MPPQQLALPLPEIASSPSRVGIPRAQRIFVNRHLNLSGIDWIGFDMDYTLAVYDQDAMDRLSMTATIEKLTSRGYPAALTETAIHPHFAIRGLLVDKRLGHLLKMDRYRVVQKGYHGLRPLTREEIRTLYHPRKLRFTSQRYHWVDTLYTLGEAALYAGMVDILDAGGAGVDYGQLFLNVRECADEAHRDGTISARLLADLPRYVRRDPLLAPTFHKLRSAGKKLFLLTNSSYPYTSAVMTHLLGNAMPEYPSWRHYFDVVITSATKPAFFQERRPLLEREVDSARPGQLRPTNHIERGRVYEGGNLTDLERMLGVTGDRILYVGDHIYGDILRSKKEASWRTAMIIQEMDAEVRAHEASSDDLQKLSDLNARRNRLEDELRAHQNLYKDFTRQMEAAGPGADPPILASLEIDRGRVKRAVERVRGAMKAVDAETAELEHQIDRRFHPYWGSLLKEGTEVSSFGDQVQAYACVYTSRVSNLLAYSPLQNFRSPRDLMPHEM